MCGCVWCVLGVCVRCVRCVRVCVRCVCVCVRCAVYKSVLVFSQCMSLFITDAYEFLLYFIWRSMTSHLKLIVCECVRFVLDKVQVRM